MLVFLGILCLFQEKTLFIKNPSVVAPKGQVQESGLVVLNGEGFECRVTALDPKAIMARIKASGISPAIYQDEKVIKSFSRFLAFKVVIENKGTEVLTFNPDHALLTTHKDVPVGTLVRVADYWPTTKPLGDADWEKFAELFSRNTAQLESGETAENWLVFRPINKPYKGKVRLRIDRIFYGVEQSAVVCQFEAGYSKE